MTGRLPLRHGLGRYTLDGCQCITCIHKMGAPGMAEAFRALADLGLARPPGVRMEPGAKTSPKGEHPRAAQVLDAVHARHRKGMICTTPRIAEDTGLHVESVRNALFRLEEQGALTSRKVTIPGARGPQTRAFVPVEPLNTHTAERQSA